jgi:signal transduction histidine kinase
LQSFLFYTSIAVFSELVKKQIHALNPQAVPFLNRIIETSQNLIETISEIVWAVNPNSDQFDNIVLKMRFFAAEILAQKDIKLSFQIDERLQSVQLSIEERKNFYLVFKEAINNVYKYANCTQLIIDIYLKDEAICLKIEDNGQGFDTQKDTIGNGMKTMQTRANELEGWLTITSQIGKGTTLLLCFPIKSKAENEKDFERNHSVAPKDGNATGAAFK